MVDRNFAILGLLGLGAVVGYLLYNAMGADNDGDSNSDSAPEYASGSEVFEEKLDRVIQEINNAKDGTLCGFCKRELDKIKGATETLKKVAPAASWIADEKAQSLLT